MEPDLAAMVDFIVGDAFVYLFHSDFPFHPRQSSSEAEMGPVAERKVTVGSPADVEGAS